MQDLESEAAAQSDLPPEIDTPSPTMEESGTQGILQVPDQGMVQEGIDPSDHSSMTAIPEPLDNDYITSLLEVAYKISSIGLEDIAAKLRESRLSDSVLSPRVVDLACKLGKRVLDVETSSNDESLILFHQNKDDEVVGLCFCALDSIRCYSVAEGVLWLLMAGHEANSMFGEHTLDRIASELLKD